MSMIELEDRKRIINNITDVTVVPAESGIGKPMIFLTEDVRYMANKSWWHEHKEAFREGCTIHLRLTDPKMHALNISGDYTFKFDPVENELFIVSPIEVRLLYTREMKCLMEVVRNIFDVDIEEIEL